MRRTELVKNIFKDLEESLTENQITSVLHLAEAYGMLPNTVCWLATGEYGPVKDLAKLATSDYDCSICWEEE